MKDLRKEMEERIDVIVFYLKKSKIKNKTDDIKNIVTDQIKLLNKYDSSSIQHSFEHLMY